MTDTGFVTLPGSDRTALADVRDAGAVDPADRIVVTVQLRRRAELPDALVAGPESITSDELAARYGADPADLRLVEEVLTRHGLTVIDRHPGARRVRAAGSVAALTEMFGTELNRVTLPGGEATYRHRVGALRIPAELDGVVTAVLGLDDRPQARTRHRVFADAQAAARVSYTPPQLGTIYRFPAGTDGAGQALAIVELGGGFAQSDLDAYFAGLGIPTPSVQAVGVDGAQNQPGQDPSGADGEVLLDIEVAGALAPQARQTVYFGPNTDQGFLDAVTTAVHATPAPAAISISWGQSEDAWTPQARTAMDQAFADAAALGITVCVAAGDNGSSDAVTDGQVHVDFPASSPHALACGGTNLDADPASGIVRAETVWNGGPQGGSTGGGVSDAFPLPAWQATVGVPARVGGGTGRGVPDVSADADPASGYQVQVDGKQLVIGGTSAVAPLWAALIARLVQGGGQRLGLVQTRLYAGLTAGKTPAGFRDITVGNNGVYRAGPGWDACTGLGVPDGTALLAALRGTQAR